MDIKYYLDTYEKYIELSSLVRRIAIFYLIESNKVDYHYNGDYNLTKTNLYIRFNSKDPSSRCCMVIPAKELSNWENFVKNYIELEEKEDLEKKIKFLEARLKSDSERLKRFKDDLKKKASNCLREKISLDEYEEIL